MKPKYIILIPFLYLLSSCAIFKGKKDVESLKVVLKPNAKINYGNSFQVKIIAHYKNGKEKDITGKKELTVEVDGRTYKNGKIEIDAYPTVLEPDTVFLKATYLKDEKTIIYKEAIPFNYVGDLKINFNGDKGEDAKDRRNKSTPLMFRDGNDGKDGESGGNGVDGQDLSVIIWKEINGNRYRIKVVNLTTGLVYQYTYRNNGYGIRFNVNGGAGGSGGDGGDGGDGKDGVISEKKTKRPGNAGNGGNGGIGGIGGNGGTVYILIHPNAKELRNKITVSNRGGISGARGLAGEAGDVGEPKTGQDSATSGYDGVDGINGSDGNQGSPYQIVVEDFDIEE